MSRLPIPRILRRRPATRSGWRAALIPALGWALFAAVLFGGLAGWEAWQTEDGPVEQVTAIRSVKTEHWRDCGRYSTEREWVTTYRSSDPPAGLPSTFTKRSCDRRTVGITLPAVRVVHGDGHVSAYVNPPHGMGGVAVATTGGAGVVFVMAFLIYLIKGSAGDRWRGRGPKAVRN